MSRGHGMKRYNEDIEYMKVAMHPLAKKIMGTIADYKGKPTRNVIYSRVRAGRKRIDTMLDKLERKSIICRGIDDKYALTTCGAELPHACQNFSDIIDTIKGTKAFDSVAKRQVYVEYGQFLKKSIVAKPTDVHVLCLPALEFLEGDVYRSLGIPEGNIDAVERNDNVVRRLQQKITSGQLRINLHPGELIDFVKRTDQKYDIIFLDFTAYLQDKHYEIIGQIYERELLKSPSVLAVTYGRAHEQPETQDKYRDNSEKILQGKALITKADVQKLTDKIKKIDEARQAGKDKNYIPREDNHYIIGVLDYFIKEKAALRELGVDDIIKALEKNERKVLEHVRSALIPADSMEVHYQSIGAGRKGSPMALVMYKLENHEWTSHFQSSIALRKFMETEPTVMEIKGKREADEILPFTVTKPRSDISESEKVEIRRKVALYKQSLYTKDQIMREHRLTQGQLTAHIAWANPNMQKFRKKKKKDD